MKIGVFHPSFYVNGGAELVALVVTNTLARHGYDVILYTNKKFDPKETKRILGNPVHSSVKVVVNRSPVKPRTLLDTYQIISNSFVFKSKCDVLIDTYSNLFFPWADISYTHFPFMNRWVYNKRFPHLKTGHLSNIGVLPYALAERNYVNRSHKQKLVIANSQFTAQAIEDFFKLNVKILQPPVLSSFFRRFDADELRENLVVTVSRFDFNKGLDAIPHIAKVTDKNTSFVIVGLLQNQNVLKSINNRIRKLNLSHKVTLLPNISQQELQSILKRAKVYLHTTLNEHFGISIAEAMAMGCIPVVHNSGGVTEFVPETYRYNNVREAARAIDAAINDWIPAKASELTQVAEKFSEGAFSKRFINMFEQYVRNREAIS